MRKHSQALPRVGILGAGFVGITLAAHFCAVQKSNVILMENNLQKLRSIEMGEYGVWEPGLDQILHAAFKNQICQIISSFEPNTLDVLFVTVGTPLPKDPRQLDHSELLQTVIENSTAVEKGGIIYLRSTVSIGTTERIELMLAEIGREDISLYFAPERTAEGVALQELRELPQILGAAKGSNLAKGVRFLSEQGFRVFEAENSREAEFVKLACNTWRDLTFAFANELALIGQIENVNSRNVITLSNKDYSRSNIPFPGPSGGPCLTKDGYILASSHDQTISANSVVIAARLINKSVNLTILEKIKTEIGRRKNAKVVIAGIAFKGYPRTNDVRDGLGEFLLENLVGSDLKVTLSIWDPYILAPLVYQGERVKNEFFNGMTTDILIIANNSKEFESPEFISECRNLPRESIIIDCWQVLNRDFLTQAERATFGSDSWNG